MQSRNGGAGSEPGDAPKLTKGQFGCGLIIGILLLLFGLGGEGGGSWIAGVIGLLVVIAMIQGRSEAKKQENIEQKKLTGEAAAKVAQKLAATKKLQDEVVATIKKHGPTLRRKRLQLLRVDDYGNTFTDAWEREVEYFLSHVISPIAGDLLLDARQAEWVHAVIEWASQESMDYGGGLDVASMNPIEYELYCADLLRGAGWEARVTSATGDQGVDVIATRGGQTLVVQAKLYSGSVGNAAVQQALAGKQFVGADMAAVVSPAQFTRSAVELANTTGVLLLHHDDLRTL